MCDESPFEKRITGEHTVAIAIMFGYNEQDIVVSTIFNALKQGLHVYYVDDGSTDDTRQLVKQFFSDNVNVGYSMIDATYKDNSVSEKSWNLKRQLEYKAKLARTMFHDYSWLLHMDCDEVYECRWASSVVEGLQSLPDTVGKVNCDVHDYFPSSDDRETWRYETEKKVPMLDITSVLSVFRKRNDSIPYYRFLRISDSLDLELGHRAKTQPDAAHTQNMIMHHYPYRSKELAGNKVAKDRLPRIAAIDAQTGVGWHYKLVNDMQLPINMKDANQNVIINDGRYVTYYLRRAMPSLKQK